MFPAKAKDVSSKKEDSLALARWVKSISDSIFYNPVVVLPWLDSVSNYADSTKVPMLIILRITSKAIINGQSDSLTLPLFITNMPISGR